MTGTADHSNGTRTAATWLIASLCLLLTVLLLTDHALPALSSGCGRLEQVVPGPDSLSMNHARLRLPAGAAWRDIALDYRLADNEALSFVVQRAGAQLVVLRLSRHPRLVEMLAVYRDGRLETVRPVEPGEPAGRLELHRDGDGLRAVRNGELWATVGGAEAPDGTAFEVVLHPPDSTELHRRVELGEVRLEDGSWLGASLLSRLRNSRAVVLGLVALVLVLLRRPLGRLPGRVFPYQMAERPRDVVWLLACINAPFLALLALPYGERIPAFQLIMRLLLIGLVVIAVLASLAFGRLRDRLLARSAAARRSRLSHPALIPPLFVLYTAVWFVALVYGYASLMIMTPRLHVDLAKADAGEPRVVCVGGSVTRGFPFPENGQPPPFPDLLERQLRADGHPDLAVFNLGVDAAGIGYVAAHLPEQLATYRPTHLVVTSVVNDFFRDADAYRADLERIVSDARRGGVEHVLLVKELQLPMIYGPGGSHPDLYAVLDQVAAAHGATVVDPEPDFLAHRNEFLFMDWVHFTPRGNALMAAILARQFTRAPQPPGWSASR